MDGVAPSSMIRLEISLKCTIAPSSIFATSDGLDGATWMILRRTRQRRPKGRHFSRTRFRFRCRFVRLAILHSHIAVPIEHSSKLGVAFIVDGTRLDVAAIELCPNAITKLARCAVFAFDDGRAAGGLLECFAVRYRKARGLV